MTRKPETTKIEIRVTKALKAAVQRAAAAASRGDGDVSSWIRDVLRREVERELKLRAPR